MDYPIYGKQFVEQSEHYGFYSAKQKLPALDYPVTTDDIANWLDAKYNFDGVEAGRYITVKELRCGTGYKIDANRYLDYWAMPCWEKDGGVGERVSYEIKVSRSDFRKEIKEPVKRKMGLNVSNLFYFVTPAGLLKPEEVPSECGLIELFWRECYHHRYHPRVGRWESFNEIPLQIYRKLVGQTVVPAPHRDPNFLSWKFVAQLSRQLNARETILRQRLEYAEKRLEEQITQEASHVGS